MNRRILAVGKVVNPDLTAGRGKLLSQNPAESL